MNRLLVAAIAAALSQFALACHTDRTEVYEPAPAGQTADEGSTAEHIDVNREGDAPGLNFPVPATVQEPVDLVAARIVDDGRSPFNGNVLNPTTQMPPVIDRNRLDVIGEAPTETVDPNENLNNLPGIGVNPLLVTDPAPSRGNASTQIEGANPF